MMISQSLIKKHLDQVLYGFSRVFIVFFLLEVVFFQILNHLLPTMTKLAVELYHRHVFNCQIVSTSTISVLCSFLLLLLHLLAFFSGCRHCCSHCHLLFSFLLHLELLPHDVPLNFTQLIISSEFSTSSRR